MKLILALAIASASALIELDGSGTTNPSKYYWDVMSLFEARAKPAVRMTYRAVGSSNGQFDFMGADQGWEAFNDFGSGDMPFSKDKYDDMRANGVTPIHVPFALGAMSFFHNVPSDVQPSGGVRLDACTLADIFNGKVTTWDDDAVLDLNPGFAPPSGEEIVVYHRTFGSSTTKGITTYLRAACPDRWGEDMVGSLITWPESTKAVEGSGEMSAMIQATPYSIGYIDSGHGLEDGLTEISLENLDGKFQTSSEAIEAGGVQMAAEEALDIGVLPDDPTADFSEVSLFNMPGEYTWPIVAVSYLYVRADQTGTGAKGPLLAAFVEYVLSAEGQGRLLAYNFQGAPGKVLDVSRKALDLMELDGGAETWTFEDAETGTIKGLGQNDFVISSKRRSHYEYAIGELEGMVEEEDDEGHGGPKPDGDVPPHSHDGGVSEAEVKALRKRVEDLEALVSDVEGTCEAGCSGALGKGGNDDDDKVDENKKNIESLAGLAAAALVVGLVGLIVGAVACCRVNRLVSGRKGVDAARDCVPVGSRASEAQYELSTNPNGNGKSGSMKRGFQGV